MYKLRVRDDLLELIRGLHPELKSKLRRALHAVVSNPHCGKSLRDELTGFRSYRVSHLRVIYRIAPRGRIIDVVAIGPRARIYDDTLRLLERDLTAGR